MDVRETIAEIAGARVERVERIQSLWDGYGEIVRAWLPDRTVIAKNVRAPAGAHPRKKRSYEVELEFYRRWAPRCDERCRVAKLVGHRGSVVVLEDLGSGRADLETCVDWLAAFHLRFLGAEPVGLWKIGTYWHLGTRPDELAAMRDRDLQRRAPSLDHALRAARFQTIVHGDAKPENFLGDAAVDRHRRSPSAIDFQYVGGGPGIVDVAYLLWRERDESRLLRAYLEKLPPDVAHEWGALYDTAREDFRRFLDGWRR
ncbi:MAG TPA: phosphotransferase [Polyangiaceae bacterium]|nr:phosphotransferase [Polyangiaceae bacterium]